MTKEISKSTLTTMEVFFLFTLQLIITNLLYIVLRCTTHQKKEPELNERYIEYVQKGNSEYV